MSSALYSLHQPADVKKTCLSSLCNSILSVLIRKSSWLLLDHNFLTKYAAISAIINIINLFNVVRKIKNLNFIYENCGCTPAPPGGAACTRARQRSNSQTRTKFINFHPVEHGLLILVLRFFQTLWTSTLVDSSSRHQHHLYLSSAPACIPASCADANHLSTSYLQR